MGRFGENLRRERELRHVSLEEISAATRIGVRFLSAIEREEFEKLPGGIFNRGFVRAFANYVGLDEEKVLAEFELASGEVDLTPARTVPRSTVDANYARPVLIALLVLLVAAGSLYTYYTRPSLLGLSVPEVENSSPTSNRAAPASLPTPAPSAVTPTPPAARAMTQSPVGTAENNTASNPLGSSGSEPATTPAAMPGTDESKPRLRLQVDVVEPSWVSVTADGRRVFARTLKPRDPQTVTASKEIRLTTGNASAVVLTLNGETLAPLGKPGEVRTVTLTEKDLKPASP